MIVRAADAFYEYIDGWHGVISDRPSQAGGIWIVCQSPSTPQQQIGPLLQFLVPPDELERYEETTED